MHGWTYRRYGGPEVLEWTSLPETPPGEGEIAVRVACAALNPLDWKLREGHFRLFARGVPRGMGYDYSGHRRSGGARRRGLQGGRCGRGHASTRCRAANGTLAERINAPAALAAAEAGGRFLRGRGLAPGRRHHGRAGRSRKRA